MARYPTLQQAIMSAARTVELRGFVFGADVGYDVLRPGKLSWAEAETLDGDVEAAREAAAAHIAGLKQNTKSARLAVEDFTQGDALAKIKGAPLAVRVYAQAWFMSVARHDGRAVAEKVAAAKAGERPSRPPVHRTVPKDWMADIHVPVYVPPVGMAGELMTRKEAAGYFVGRWWRADARIPSMAPTLRRDGLHDASVLGISGGGGFILPAHVTPKSWHECQNMGVWVTNAGRTVTLHFPGGTISTNERKMMPPWTRPSGPVGRLHPWDGIVFGD